MTETEFLLFLYDLEVLSKAAVRRLAKIEPEDFYDALITARQRRMGPGEES